MNIPMQVNKPLRDLPSWKVHYCATCEHKHWNSIPLFVFMDTKDIESIRKYRIAAAHRLCGWHEIVELERIQASF